MKLSDFDYHLPSKLIARYPTSCRSNSRLLYVNNNQYKHRKFNDLPQLLNEKDLLVFNNSRVIPARLFAQKPSGGKVEILLERIIDDYQALAHVKASKSPRAASHLVLFDKTNIVCKDTIATVVERQDELFMLKFSHPIDKILSQCGHIPLPPYLNRQEETMDTERYQTVYATHNGSVAAPTAGLHFDDTTLDNIHQRNIDTAFVTLHVGAGTFQPVRCENIDQHRMHKEWIEVNSEVCDKIAETKARGGRVVAVGTTTVRCLETAKNKAYFGDTDIFISPGYKFHTIDMLLTNFHLPRSSLLMLVAAFAGYAQTMQAYRIAIEDQYRFYSYGDAMLIAKSSEDHL